MAIISCDIKKIDKFDDPICSLADRPKTYSRQGLKLVDGKWIPNVNVWATGGIDSHVAKVWRGKGKYYV